MKTKKEYFQFLKMNKLEKTAIEIIPFYIEILLFYLIIAIIILPILIWSEKIFIEILSIIIYGVFVLTIIFAYFKFEWHLVWLYRDKFISREILSRSVSLRWKGKDHKKDQFCLNLFKFRKNLREMTAYDNLKLLVD